MNWPEPAHFSNLYHQRFNSGSFVTHPTAWFSLWGWVEYSVVEYLSLLFLSLDVRTFSVRSGG
jgi:hypothetical protein